MDALPLRKPRSRAAAARWIVALAIAGAAGVAAAAGARALLPPDAGTARGLRIGGAEIPEGARPRAAAEDRARAALARRVRLTWAGEVVLDATIAELGGAVDVTTVAAQAAAVGREGDLLDRFDAALLARRGRVDLPLSISLPIEPLAARLEQAKDDRDNAPRASKLDLEKRTPVPGAPGRYLDVYAAAAAIDRALAAPPALGGVTEIAIPAFEIAPRASPEVVAAIDISHVLSRFETRFGYRGAQANRAQNIERAADLMNGVVLMPGEVVSFNRNVGPRSVDNGFATAPEIYKGEMRDGVGGGTCQVSGTLHAAAFFGGIEIVERSNHSRPSGYIRMGLDATVVYPTVDLKLRNPYEFPIVLRAAIDKGALVFELLGRDKPATVDLETATVGVSPFKRKVEEAPWVKEGKLVVKQKGIKGYAIRKTRTIHLRDAGERVEVTTDIYPPTFEIFLVHPGTDIDELLPPEDPLPDARTATNEPPAVAPPGPAAAR